MIGWMGMVNWSMLLQLLGLSMSYILFRPGAMKQPAAEAGAVTAVYKHQRVSVIIPARNEADNLKVLLPLLKQQDEEIHEIIVVDDSSEDDTAVIARSQGVRVVAAQPLPHGWQGKSWACWNGALQADGEWLLFLDADTMPSVSLISRLGKMLRLRGGYITVQPYHTVPTFREQWSAIFNVMVVAGSGALSMLPQGITSFGPCAACSHQDYVKVGGHQAIRAEVLEHMQLGERFRAHGLPVYGLLDEQLLQFRMYPSGWKAMVNGWIKSIAIGAGATAVLRLMLSIVWLAALIGSGADAIQAVAGLIAGGVPVSLQPIMAISIYGLAVISVSRGLRVTGSFHLYTMLLYPLFILFFIVLFSYAVFRSYVMRRVNWKGRTLDVN